MALEGRVETGPYKEGEFPSIGFMEFNGLDQDTFYNVAKKAQHHNPAGIAEFNQIRSFVKALAKSKAYSENLAPFFEFVNGSRFFFFDNVLNGGSPTSAYVYYITMERGHLEFGKMKFSKVVGMGPRWNHTTDVAVIMR